MKEVSECFTTAKKTDNKGKKHKGLLIGERDEKRAVEYIEKAKKSIELCYTLKEQRFDYKIPEEWFYTLYYCALAILAKYGIESRSQRCTALFLKYVNEKHLLDLNPEFINRITVYSEKEFTSDVDEREKARYGSSVQSEEIMQKFDYMVQVCKKCINDTEEIVYSKNEFIIPNEFK